MSDNKLLTVKEVAELLRVTEDTVDNYVKSGSLKCIRLSRKKRYFNAEYINRIIEGREIIYYHRRNGI